MNKKILSILLVGLCIFCVGCTDKDEEIIEKTEPIQKVNQDNSQRAYQEFKDRENVALQKDIAYKYRDKNINATIEYNVAIKEDAENKGVLELKDVVLSEFPDNKDDSITYTAYFTDSLKNINIKQYINDNALCNEYQSNLDEATYEYVKAYIEYVDENNIVDYGKIGTLMEYLIDDDTEQIVSWIDTNAPVVFKNNYVYQNYELQDVYKG